MKRILVICHIEKNRYDGQQSKTNDIIASFKNRGYDVDILNYGLYSILRLIILSIKKIKSHNSILLLPGGRKALYTFVFLSRFFKKKNFYYLAVGGWVTDLILNKRSRRKLKPLKKFKAIILQNKQSVETFNSHSFNNVYFIPTFSSKKSISTSEFEKSLNAFENSKKFRFCFFARVEGTKGVFEACNVIRKLVENKYDVSFDIYGQIQKKEIEEKLAQYLDDHIKYQGVLHDESIKVLSSYYCMLFPTYYRGEGMAHSIIESFMAGLPVIASDWRFNSELVKNGKTGFLFDLGDFEDNLYKAIVFAIENKEIVKAMRLNCFSISKDYDSDTVLKPFIDMVDQNY